MGVFGRRIDTHKNKKIKKQRIIIIKNPQEIGERERDNG